MPQSSVTKIYLKIVYLNLHSNFPGVNELTQSQWFLKNLGPEKIIQVALPGQSYVCNLARGSVGGKQPNAFTHTNKHGTNNIMIIKSFFVVYHI